MYYSNSKLNGRTFLENAPLSGRQQQQTHIPMADRIAFHPRIVRGVLENGLTYHVLHNAKGKRAELRLVVKVGSMAEEEHQRGLAHFIEQ
jgi:predicted Zn-dependent peptidase